MTRSVNSWCSSTFFSVHSPWSSVFYRGRDACHHTPPAQIPAGGIPAPGSHLGCLTAKRLLGHGCVMRGFGSHRFCSTVIRCHVTFPFCPRQHNVRRQMLVTLKRKSPSAAELVGTA